VEAGRRQVEGRDFPPAPRSVAEVRAFVVAQLGPDFPRTDDAVWLASELATNAVLHARSHFQVTVSTGARQVRVEVADDDPHMPLIAARDTGATSGRGLPIIDAVADDWGAHKIPGDGKTVWFTVNRR
jgi:anti-sigma regulatory factor (Ser/Thr protein kinase)